MAGSSEAHFAYRDDLCMSCISNYSGTCIPYPISVSEDISSPYVFNHTIEGSFLYL